MDELVKIIKDDVFTNSMIIANGTGNSHEAVLRLISKYSDKFNKIGELNYDSKSSDNLKKKEVKVCSLNEPQATFLMTLLGNSGIVVDFKLELVRQFYQMRQLLGQLLSPVWKDTRSLTKEIRKKETMAIELLVEYAFTNGSKHAARYYTSLSILADKAAGISPKQRDSAGIEALTKLYLVENMIERCIQEGIAQSLSYKDIYQFCKTKLMQFGEFTSSTKSALT